MISYRPDIDGLRFLAVVPVMLFHAGIEGFGGGFVGVDVFFVISGYLITQVIRHDLDQDRFSLARFYERRARRILPALFMTILVSSAVATLILLPGQLASFGLSVRAALFYSNIYFMYSIDYFAPAAEYLPLLHTWSLAVEEQFYIVYPLLLLLIQPVPRGLRSGLLLGLFAVSLGFAIWSTRHMPAAAFYLAPARAWQLLLGGLLALGHAEIKLTGVAREAAAGVGLLGIVFPILFYSSETVFPGLAAIPPCVGTAILLQTGAGPGTAVARILSVRPLVFLGLISYSLYLLHWPILAFVRVYLDRVELAASTGLAALGGSVLLAAASWRFVEQPFRKGGLLDRRGVFRAVTAVILATAVIGTTFSVTGGIPGRFSERVNALAAAADDQDPRMESCLSRTPADGFCRIGADNGRPADFLLWGDSHAGAMIPALDAAGRITGHAGLVTFASACPPLLGVRKINSDESCPDFNAAVLRDLAANGQEIETVFLVARWARYSTGRRPPGQSGAGLTLLLVDAEALAQGFAGNVSVVERGLRRTIEALRALGKSVVLIAGVPEIGWDVPNVLARAERRGVPHPAAPTAADYARRNRAMDEIVQRIRETIPIRQVSLAEVLCQSDCAIIHEDRPMYFDDNHLSRYGASEVVGPAIARQLWPAQ